MLQSPRPSNRFVPTSQRERPARMITGERGPQPEFPASEEVYRRFQAEHFVQNVLSNIGLPFPRTSFNRQSLSEPEDVLWHDQEDRRFEGWGVFAVTAAQTRMCLPTGDGRTLNFDLEHNPLPLNYSHTELKCIDVDAQEEVKRPSNKVRKEYHVELSRAASKQIIINPQV